MAVTTRERIVTSAMTLMQERGYGPVSIDNICRAAGVSKGAVFHHFDSKQGVGVAALDQYCATLRDHLAARATGEPVARVAAFFDALIEVYEGGLLGPNRCLIGVFGQEQPSSAPDLRAHVGRLFGGWVDALAERMSDAGAAAPAVLARQAIAVVEGALILHAADGDTDALVATLASYRDLITTHLNA